MGETSPPGSTIRQPGNLPTRTAPGANPANHHRDDERPVRSIENTHTPMPRPGTREHGTLERRIQERDNRDQSVGLDDDLTSDISSLPENDMVFQTLGLSREMLGQMGRGGPQPNRAAEENARLQAFRTIQPDHRAAEEIARLQAFRTTQPSKARAQRRRNGWTADETERLLALWLKHGNAWSLILHADRKMPNPLLGRRDQWAIKDKIRNLKAFMVQYVIDRVILIN